MMVPNALDISILETLALLDGEFAEFADGLANDKYAVWLGAGISLSKLPGLEGVAMELEDCSFPTLKEMVLTDDPARAFQDCNFALLVGSNVFMTTAWYWHLRYMQVPLFSVILFSWALAFIEYCLAVPANRYGSAVYSAAQLKTIQEVITFMVFAVFSFVYLKEPITWSQGVGFTLIAAGAFFVFHKW